MPVNHSEDTLTFATLERVKPPKSVAHDGGLRIACGIVEIEPYEEFGPGIAGFSIIGQVKGGIKKQRGALCATIMLIEDSAGERVALIGADLHSGTRYLSERIAKSTCEGLSEGAHLSVDRVVLFASHTHNAPDGIWGVNMYDRMAGSRWGFKKAVADQIAGDIAHGLKALVPKLAPGHLEVRQGKAAGLWANRSLPAFVNNADDVRDRLVGLFAAGDPTVDYAVDPRFWVLSAHDDSAGAAGAMLGAIAFVPAHPTTISPRAGVFSPDSFGVAASYVGHHLRNVPWTQGAWLNERPMPISVVIAHGADANIEDREAVSALMNAPEKPAESRGAAMGRLTESRGEALTRSIGEQLGKLLVETIEGPADSRSGPEDMVTVRFSEALTGLASNGAWVGESAKGASEFGHYFLAKLRERDLPGVCDFLRVAQTAPDEGTLAKKKKQSEPGHWPKRVQRLRWISGQPPSDAPRRVVDIGRSIRICATSFEVSAALGVRILDACRAGLLQDATVLLAGVSGGYTSYASTRAEYDAQHYEGASNLWGQQTGEWLLNELVSLSRRKKSTSCPTGVCEYHA